MPPIELRQANLPRLPRGIRTPAYDRGRLRPGIVHVGVGGFHRAHQAVYLDDWLGRAGDPAWGVCGVGLLAPDRRMRDALVSQDHLYTVVEREAAGARARVVGSIIDYALAADDPRSVLDRMASPDCRIVSLTITEGGYYINQGDGSFDDRHPDIRHDLAHPCRPTCTLGYLAEALDWRRRRGLAPFTVLSCDNLLGNGDIARRVLLDFLELRNPTLRAWVSAHGAFPNGMVDRITPATTDEIRALVRDEFGISDAWPVATEPFRQWVIEDEFPLGRPAWEEVGVLMTGDVLPYEKMKIRLLNGGHQALCYVCMLLGYTTVHEALCDGRIRKLVRGFMDREVTPLLPAVTGIDLGEYKDSLIERFVNPAIRDQLARLGTEGSARIPKFVLPSIVEQLERGGPIRSLSFVVACWFRFLRGADDRGRALPIDDPMAGWLGDLARDSGPDPRPLLALGELFGDVLPRSSAFVEQVADFLRQFEEAGVEATLSRLVEP